jgi:hypothetical protein
MTSWKLSLISKQKKKATKAAIMSRGGFRGGDRGGRGGGFRGGRGGFGGGRGGFGNNYNSGPPDYVEGTLSSSLI